MKRNVNVFIAVIPVQFIQTQDSLTVHCANTTIFIIYETYL